MSILFVIYSCVKYLNKAEQLYAMLYGKLGSNVQVRIAYGRASDDQTSVLPLPHHIMLPCGDGYNDLTEKTLALLNYVAKQPHVSALIKCDDDILPNISFLNTMIKRFSDDLQHVMYAGKAITVQNHYSTWHIGKGGHNSPIFVPDCTYCTGPIYYMRKEVATALANSTEANTLDKFYSEDVTVGYNVQKCGFQATNIPLYTDNYHQSWFSNLHNIDGKTRFVYGRLHGGLGNQIFQAAATLGIARKTGRYPILLYTEDSRHYVHNSDLFEYIKTIFHEFPCLPFNPELLQNAYHWNETDPNLPQDYCFTYQASVINNLILNPNIDIFLNGYFQNEKYFKTEKTELMKLIFNANKFAEIQAKYPKTAESYFMHVRRGDYVNHALYTINYDAYAKTALDNIAYTETTPIHIYVLTNDVNYCKNYSLLSDSRFVFTILDDPDMTTLDTIYFMAACKKGGICANSSFSWWGSYFNTYPNKTVYFPGKWMNNIPGNRRVDVYYEGSTVIPL